MGDQPGNGDDEKDVDKNSQGWLLEWETNLGMVMMKKTLTRTSKAGFLNWESICFDVSRAYCC